MVICLDKIELIASDADMTLLPANAVNLSGRTADLIKKLCGTGVVFAAASGRTYQELLSIFKDVKNDIYFIALDGSLAVYKGNVIFSSPVERKYLEYTEKKMNKSNILFYGKDKTYFKWKNEDYGVVFNPHHKNAQRINSVSEINEDIYKITFYRENSYEFGCYKKYVKNNRIFDTLYDDGIWCDFTNRGISKKTPLCEIMKEKGIKRENAAAFGDNTNDIEMLKYVRHSFCMKDGKKEAQSVAKYITADVEKELERVVLNGGI